jgi:photosystem II stability/assembly factor-like uncharacterized protein
MRIILLLLISLPFIACKKNHDNLPPSAVDTLATGWKKVTVASLPPSGDIFFINNTTGFVIGGNFIFRSTDGGNTWQNVYHPATSPVNIAMGSTTNALFTTNNGNPSKMFVTSNGGNSFDSVTIADGISDAFFVSPTVAYAIGSKCWKTTNGGLNWTSLVGLGPTGYRSLHFLNEQTGWCAGIGGVFNTTNSGVNWNPQPTPTFNFGLTGNVYFTDANNGYISDDNSVGKTINGGAAWTKIYALQGGYHDLHFLTTNTGYVTDYYYIYKTIDGGNTWTREVRLASDMIIELHFTDANHGWATGGSGYILKYER